MFDLQLLFFGLWWSLWKKRITIPTPKNWLCGLSLLGWWVSGWVGGDHFCSHFVIKKKSLQPFRCSRRVDIGRPSRQRTPGPELANGCTRWRNSSNLTFLVIALQWRISSDKKLILWLQVKAEMVLGRLVQKDGHLATDVDGNPRKVRLGQRQMQS